MLKRCEKIFIGNCIMQMARVNDEIHLSEEDLSGNMSGLEDEEASVEDSIMEKANLNEIESMSALHCT